MLNTDLHNVAIQPKVQVEQYVASCHRCGPLRDVPDEYLRRLYLSVLSSPLRISRRHLHRAAARVVATGRVCLPACLPT